MPLPNIALLHGCRILVIIEMKPEPVSIRPRRGKAHVRVQETPQPVSPWGKSAAIDLYNCAHDRLTDPKLLKQFVTEVIPLIGMEAHGPCYVDRFGEGDIEGLSAMQFIKTSSITVHLDEVGNRAFIDIFSCKDFDADKASAYAKEVFQAKEIKSTVLER